jgi:hypothetical protein
MDWKGIKQEITKQLKSEERDLASDRRLNALESIEKIIPDVYLKNPTILKQIGKENLLKELSLKKKLNGAEIGIINHIFSVLFGEQIAIKKRNG